MPQPLHVVKQCRIRPEAIDPDQLRNQAGLVGYSAKKDNPAGTWIVHPQHVLGGEVRDTVVNGEKMSPAAREKLLASGALVDREAQAREAAAIAAAEKAAAKKGGK